MVPPRVVLDTNVLVAGLRSRGGASFGVLSEVGRGRFEVAVSVPLVLEYEEALRRKTSLGDAEVDAVLDYLCSVARLQSIFFLWRPVLPDPGDDLVLELAVAAECQAIVTHNVRDFAGSDRFGVSIWRPVELLQKVGVIS